MRIFIAATVLLSGCATQEDPGVVTTDTGAVRGTVSADTRMFQGIRYATAARWESPRPAGKWKGVLDAAKPGAMCPQVGSEYAKTASDNEDCLFLNVTTPAKKGTKRPVMVWFHGDGALGAGNLSDARRIARQGDAVLVTINYRLGVFSGFGYPGLKNSGTYGLQDQQESLRWVKRNAAAFGGDPSNVTVFGVSYGALAIGGHLTSPGAAGLFQRAIMQSGETMMDMPANSIVPGVPEQPTFAWRSAADAVAVGEHYAKQLGCADLACLRALPVKKILAVPQIMNAFQVYAYGNDVLPTLPSTALREGRFHRVPVLAGATKDEHRIFVGMNYAVPGVKPDYPALLREAFGADAKRIAKEYPPKPTPELAWAQVLTDRMWARGVHEQNTLLAKHVPVYGYEFADRKAPMFLPFKVDFDWGAFHAGELPYLFDDPQGKLTQAQRGLSAQMIGYWTSFARNGDPNRAGLPAWPRLADGTQSLAPGDIRPIDYAAEHRLAFWN